jgi:metal-responsive CopG/Arc/MetJ family transcriptional regulator
MNPSHLKDLIMFGPKIRIDKALYERLGRAAERAGYASTDEFIRHALEREAGRIEEAEEDEQVEQQLRGLGYIE